MDVDRILYIFGSLTRKRQDKRKSMEQSTSDPGNSSHQLPVQRSISQNLNIAPRTSAYSDGGKNKTDKSLECGLCKKQLEEPRLLGCLHSFCTRCLQRLHQEGEGEVWSEVDGDSLHLRPQQSSSGSRTGSAASGYESDLHSDSSWETKPRHYGIYTRKISGKSVQFLICPTCGYETTIPLGGISALPPDYVSMRTMITIDQQDDRASVLCDLCNCDNKAESRCTQCLVSVCSSCGEEHGKKKATATHSLHPLDPAAVKYCTEHPAYELSVYCASCQLVVCGMCAARAHMGHACAGARSAASSRARLLRAAAARALAAPAAAARDLHAHAVYLEKEASRLEEEVSTWASGYVRAVEMHVRAMRREAGAAHAQVRRRAARAAAHLQLVTRRAHHAAAFTHALVSAGSEDEVLSLSGPVLSRLESVAASCAGGELRLRRAALRLSLTAPGPAPPLVGRIVPHDPRPERTLLHTDGLQDLQVDRPHEAILELRDGNDERVWCGGDEVACYFRRRDSSARPTVPQTVDRGDGTYSVVLTPPSPGSYLLAVTLNNTPIKGSPFSCAARVSKAHTGQFHCCSYCSSAGRRDVVCGCGASMGDGFKGCAHGRGTHPGTAHWSCCGSTAPRGLCARPTNTTYHFSL